LVPNIPSECAALLHVAHADVLEAGEQARLHVAVPIHQTEVELAFLPVAVVHVLAFDLECHRGVKRREEAALAGERHVAGHIGADVQAEYGKLMCLAARIFDRLGDLGHLGRFGLGRGSDLIDVLFQTGLAGAQVGDVPLQAVVFALEVAQQRQDFVELVKFLEDRIAAIFLLLGDLAE
jgi:hypothetical protein